MSLPPFDAFVQAGFILLFAFGIFTILNWIRVLIRNRWFTDVDYFGDKIKGKWIHLVNPGERSLTHSIYHWRCNYCGQKKLAQLEYQDCFGVAKLNRDNTRDYLCGACGVKYNASLFEVEVKVLRGCTDPIPELRRPATHTEVRHPYPQGIGRENRINVCKTCNGEKWTTIPGFFSAGHPDEARVKARCPDCYSRDDSTTDSDTPAPAKISARRRAIEHTKALNKASR